jgi:hypothetical protein
MLAVFVLINVLTASRAPTVWQDEVQLLDPPASLYFGKGFHSAAFGFYTKEQAYFGNGMTYEWLMYGWISVFGFSPTAVRSLNFVLMAATIAMTCSAARRTGVIPTPRGRIVLALLLMCGNGISFSFRSGRYDILGATLLSAAFLAHTISNPRPRHAVLALLGAATVWTGVQLGPATIAMGLALMIVARRSTWRSILSWGIGAAIGLAGLLTVLYALGKLRSFFAVADTVAYRGATGLNRIPAAIKNTVVSWFRLDFSLTPLLLLLALYLLVRARSAVKPPSVNDRPLFLFGALAATLIPLLMFLVGHYPVYYSWMSFVPVAVVAAALWDRVLRDDPRRLVRGLSVAMLMLACLIGLPLRLALLSLEWKQRDYAPVERFVEENVRPGERVYCDYAPYYPVKRMAEWTFTKWYLQVISAEEANRISVLVINPEYLDEVQQALGGQWKATGAVLTPSPPPDIQVLRKVRSRVGAKLYSLAIYRRADEPQSGGGIR